MYTGLSNMPSLAKYIVLIGYKPLSLIGLTVDTQYLVEIQREIESLILRKKSCLTEQTILKKKLSIINYSKLYNPLLYY